MQAVGGSVLDGTQSDAANAFVLNLDGHYDEGLVAAPTAGDAFLFSAHKSLIDFHAAVQWVASRPNNGAAQFVQPSPGRPVTASPKIRCRPRALVPFFWLVMYQIARNESVRGACVSWKIVPAVTEL